jgi:hypothetical protein
MFANNPGGTIAARGIDVAQEQQYYLPYDAYRGRKLLGAFPENTADRNGVRAIVQHFRNSVKYWEGRNEPNYFLSAPAFVAEIANFYADVKSQDIDGSLRVIGPGPVDILPGSNGLGYIQDFLASGGGAYIDGVSFHLYNNFLGDLFMARRSMDGLVSVLNQYGAQGKERWQTEQGFGSAINGSYQPRTGGRWTMLMLMVLEQYGVPKEQNYIFYDKSNGFWDVPSWWINEDGTLNPVGCLLRVWSEEVYGTRFTSAYNFGTAGNKQYIGSLFTGPGKQVAAFMSAGSTDGQVRLQISAPSVRVVNAFGIERDIVAQGGFILLPVSELPTYVRFAGSLAVVPQSWGTNLLAGKPVTSTVMAPHPSDASIINPTTKVTNGEFENWYYFRSQETKVWVDGSLTMPAWVELNLQQPTTLDRVVIYSGVPWQWDGTLLDYDLQYDQGGQWVTLQSVFEPPRTWKTFTITNRTTVDSFFSDRWVFSHSFTPVTTQKLRLWVRKVSYGGGATIEVDQAGGQTGLPIINLREVEAYLSGTQNTANLPPTAAGESGSSDQEGVEIRALANDSDPDAWPEPLRLASVGPAAHGHVSIVGDRIRYVPTWGYSGPDSFTYTVTDGLATATATVSMAANFINPPKASGLVNFKAEYFSDLAMTNLVATEYNHTKIDYFKVWSDPGPYGMNAQLFAIRWTGQLRIAYSGFYDFATFADDRSRMWLDGQLVIDDWDPPHAAFHARKRLYLEGGRTYNIRVDYGESGGNSVMRFYWFHRLQPTETDVSIVPMENWRRSVFNTAQLANSAVSGIWSTPAQDGISNIMKYAFALPPTTPAGGSSALPQASSFLEAGRRYLALTYRKNAAATDVSYEIWATDNLAPGFWDELSPPEEILGYDGANPIVRRRVDVTDSPRKFIRLQIR